MQAEIEFWETHFSIPLGLQCDKRTTLYVHSWYISPIKGGLNCLLVLSFACTFVRWSAGESKTLFWLSLGNNVSCYIIQRMCNISNISGLCENCSYRALVRHQIMAYITAPSYEFELSHFIFHVRVTRQTFQLLSCIKTATTKTIALQICPC